MIGFFLLGWENFSLQTKSGLFLKDNVESNQIQGALMLIVCRIPWLARLTELFIA